MRLFNLFTKWKKPSQGGGQTKKSKIENGLKIVDQLEQIGYFKYAHKDHIDELKRGIAEHLNKYQNLSSVYEGNRPYNSKDFRYYPLDGEDLFEPDGITDKLEEMQPLFEKMDFKFTISNHIEEWNTLNEWLNHSIIINDKRYIIFKDFKGYGWGEAAQRLADILNDQLEIQGKDERFYLINGGNDGRGVFLTEEQFNLLDQILMGSMDRPLKVIDWCRMMEVDPNWR